jgi:anhydro-N-acetylmuramic acid kinase
MLVLGLMAGTSADGIDVALARISGAPPQIKVKLREHTTLPFPAALRAEILRVAEQTPAPAGEISQLNFRAGQVFAEAILAACRKFRVPPGSVTLVGSHGQTIFHQGNKVMFCGAATASTLQIGEPSVIAGCTGIATVGDFRPADMALDGQGAPLAPFADYVLYRDAKVGRVSLNIGGIANVTVLPAGARPAQVTAFDTGPGNMVIDALVSRFTKGRMRFDRDARLARQGGALPALVDELMGDPYLRMKPPKSTGREYFGKEYVARLLALGRKHNARPNDLIRAATVFTALSIVDALYRFVLPRTTISQLIISGGGAHNPLIVGQISAALPGIAVLPSSHFGVPEDAKEALAFALLAYETFHGRAANLPSATGARGPSILGKICYAPPR